MAVMPGKANRGLAWLLLLLVVSTVCLRSCHASRCSPKGCMVHFGKRIAPSSDEDAEPATEYLNAKDYGNQRQRNLQVLRLVDRLLSGSMTSRNSPLDDETK